MKPTIMYHACPKCEAPNVHVEGERLARHELFLDVMNGWIECPGTGTHVGLGRSVPIAKATNAFHIEVTELRRRAANLAAACAVDHGTAGLID